MSQYLPYVVHFLPILILFLSEMLPFVKSTKANGVLHAIVLILKAVAAKLGIGEAKVEEEKK
jgi:hypothetical protein